MVYLEDFDYEEGSDLDDEVEEDTPYYGYRYEGPEDGSRRSWEEEWEMENGH